VRRWYITGGAGSGKTTLAADLAARLGIPHYDVDRGELPAHTDDEWIVEGAHIWAMDRFVEDADKVVWLDLRPRVTIRRIL
jgi:adenylate kinase family enzyme